MYFSIRCETTSSTTATTQALLEPPQKDQPKWWRERQESAGADGRSGKHMPRPNAKKHRTRPHYNHQHHHPGHRHNRHHLSTSLSRLTIVGDNKDNTKVKPEERKARHVLIWSASARFGDLRANTCSSSSRRRHHHPPPPGALSEGDDKIHNHIPEYVCYTMCRPPGLAKNKQLSYFLLYTLDEINSTGTRSGSGSGQARLP